MGYHILIGLVYAWILRELWAELNFYYIALAVFGSLVMDVDHLVYALLYGRKDSYAKQVKNFLRHGKIRTLFSFWSKNHKKNTSLWSHNIYVAGALLGVSLFSFLKDMETGVVLFGSMFLHLLFDIFDDLLILGEMNSNWKRFWGKK